MKIIKSLIVTVIVTLGLILSLVLAGYHIVWKPIPDQLYGCTIQQQAPNGDCP